jgi:hypothetical protein
MKDLRAARKIVMLVLSMSLFMPVARGQKGPGANSSTSQASNQPSSSGQSGNSGGGSASGGTALPGISYTNDSWDRKIRALPPPNTFDMRDDDFESFWDFFSHDSFRKNVIIYCYKLRPNLSATQPFILEPESVSQAKPGKTELCANTSNPKSLLMSRFLVYRIDMSKIPPETIARIRTLNVNVTNQTGTSLNSQRGSTINPSPTRPSLALLSPPQYDCDKKKDKIPDKLQLAGKRLVEAICPDEGQKADIYYLTWPGELVGDTIPTVSINLVYTPVAPALMWSSGTFYPAGSVVIQPGNNTKNGHYYLALNGGISDKSPDHPPSFEGAAVAVPRFKDPAGGDPPGVVWKDMGPLVPGAANPDPWGPNHYYALNALVIPQAPNGRYYQVQRDGFSGSIEPQFPKIAGMEVEDISGLVWMDMGLTTLNPAPPIWQQGTAYASKAQVTSNPTNGHYYEAQPRPKGESCPPTPPFPATGNSGSALPALPTDGTSVSDGTNLCWLDKGLITPNPGIPAWQPGVAFAQGALVIPSSANGHYYKALSTGVAGPNSPPFPVDGTMVTEVSNLTWVDAGIVVPASPKSLKTWSPNSVYVIGDVIQDLSSGHYYSVVQAGISGLVPPNFGIPAPGQTQEQSGTPIRWQDLGTTLPASISSGIPSSDQVVNVLNLTYPQVQVLSRFNLTSGVVVSSLKPPSISSNSGTSATGCSNGAATCTVFTASRGSRLIDPVLGVTVYAFRPLDAERPFKATDLIPAPTLNISLSSPTTNFHVGASSELLMRNLQLVYGVSIVQESRLGGTVTPINGQTTGLFTTKKYNYGAFVGVTFNITGFIQSLIP